MPRGGGADPLPTQDDRDVPGYFELFFIDPDGLRIEIVHQDLEVLALASEAGQETISPQELSRFPAQRRE